VTLCNNAAREHKDDKSKPKPSLLPWLALIPVIRILEFGAKKYAAHSWKNVAPERYVEALLRHAIEFGERQHTDGILCCDQESGLPVLAHLACNALFLLGHPKAIK
jgi:hypothetical protein